MQGSQRQEHVQTRSVRFSGQIYTIQEDQYDRFAKERNSMENVSITDRAKDGFVYSMTVTTVAKNIYSLYRNAVFLLFGTRPSYYALLQSGLIYEPASADFHTNYLATRTTILQIDRFDDNFLNFDQSDYVHKCEDSVYACIANQHKQGCSFNF